jgi:N6-L-threonylcarbamoyladenine synthase
VISSSIDQHIAYGGIVPEVAARNHIEYIMPVIQQALSDAKEDWNSIDAIAVTYGPGLGGCLLIGVMTARTLAIAKNKPLYAVNHVMAHPYAAFLEKTKPEFPFLALIVSGGHSQLVLFQNHFDYSLLGQTHDDAVGEAFDKVAKILGLPYPGGPSIEKKAKEGNYKKYPLPKAKMPGKYDFSFSGLKTATLRAAQAAIGQDYNFPSHKLSGKLSEAQKADLAASFQNIAIETLVDKALLAYAEHKPKSLIVAGGVAASPELRRQIAKRLPITAIFPTMKLCTDNAAMIATLGYFMAINNQPLADPYYLDIDPSLSM